jgi:hypothetical protein
MKKSGIIKKMLPVSHGSWAFVIEPLSLALWAAWSSEGLILALGAFSAFLAHQPMRLLLNNGFQKTVFITAFLFTSLSAVSIIYFLQYADTYSIWMISAAVVLMPVFLVMDFQGNGKNILAEIIVPFTISLLAAAIFLVRNQNIYYAVSFLILLLSRSIPTVFYVRAQVRIIKGSIYGVSGLLISHLLSLIIIVILIRDNLLPAAVVIAVIFLLLRCCIFIFPLKNRLSVRQLGLSEFIFGIFFVLICGMAYVL